MKNLVWSLAVVVAVSGCMTPSKRYSALKEESLKARTLQEAVQASSPTQADIGREIEVVLAKSDDILVTPDGSSFDSYYVSYYRTYSFEASAGQSYLLTIKSSCDWLGLQKLVAVPEAYVVDGEGRLVSRVIQPVHQEGFNGGLVGEWGFTAEKNGQYVLVLAANNSAPGSEVGEVSTYTQYGRVDLPLQSTTTGSMAFTINAI